MTMLKVEEVELACLHPWEGNPRLNEHAVDAVAESIRSFGFNVPILCDQNLTIVKDAAERGVALL
jgi:ParB-like chromosome segregation protein Spo0J